MVIATIKRMNRAPLAASRVGMVDARQDAAAMRVFRLAAAVLLALVSSWCGGSPVEPTVDRERAAAQGLLPALSASPEVFVGAGDIAMCTPNAELTAKLLDSIGGTIFTLGDHAYFQGTRQQFRDCYEPTWGRHRGRTRPVPGNHDYESAGAQPYFEYFGRNAGDAGLGYYSFTLGAWRILALNSNVDIGTGSPQLEWVRREVSADPGECTLAYWHHPLFSSGPDGPASRMGDLWRVLYAAGVDVVLNGHDHAYERFGRLDPGGRPDATRGIRQFTVGTGGATLYEGGAAHPASEARIAAYGVLKLTLRAASYEWEFVTLAGTRDRGSDTCR